MYPGLWPKTAHSGSIKKGPFSDCFPLSANHKTQTEPKESKEPTKMCQTAICGLCNKKSWTGCGNHVSDVMDSTDNKYWCTCRHNQLDSNTDTKYPPKASTGRASV